MNEDNFVIIAIGKKIQLDRLFTNIESLLITPPLSKNNQNFLKKKFNITKKQMDAIIPKSQLEDLLVEKAAILI